MSQSSGTFGGLSDGTRKTLVGVTPPAKAKPAPAPKASPHRRGGNAKHAGGK